MQKVIFPKIKDRTGKWVFLLLALFLVPLLQQPAHAISLNVVGVNADGTTTPLGDGEYRWLVEEDTTYNVVPGVLDPSTLAVSFHSSYMPVAGKGEDAVSLAALSLDLSKHYFVSVLPKAAGSYSIGGAAIAAGQTQATVYVNQLPLPTAQITIFVFEDTNPINNAPDVPEQKGGFHGQE